MESERHLPYRDTKPVGAADFYFAINATFRFILARFGKGGLQRYWKEMGERYFAPVTTSWKRGGLNAIASYWKAFFAAEPGSDVEVISDENAVVLEVKTCPAIRHLREHGREIVPCFCEHCFFVSDAMANPAGFTVRIEGGNGSCRQTFLRCYPEKIPAQDLSRIKEAT